MLATADPPSVSPKNHVIPPYFFHSVGFIILRHAANQYLISLSSETDFSLKLPSSWSADTQTNSCVVASIKNEKTRLDDDCYVTGIREEVIRLTHVDLEGQVVVQTVNGSLLEYWV